MEELSDLVAYLAHRARGCWLVSWHDIHDGDERYNAVPNARLGRAWVRAQTSHEFRWQQIRPGVWRGEAIREVMDE